MREERPPCRLLCGCFLVQEGCTEGRPGVRCCVDPLSCAEAGDSWTTARVVAVKISLRDRSRAVWTLYPAAVRENSTLTVHRKEQRPAKGLPGSARTLCVASSVLGSTCLPEKRTVNPYPGDLLRSLRRAAPPCITPKEEKPIPVADTENTRGSTLGYLYDHSVFQLFKVSSEMAMYCRRGAKKCHCW